MKIKRKLTSFVIAVIMAVMSCASLTSSAYNDMDVNNDGKVSLADAVCILQYLGGNHEPTDLSRYDIDGNGVISPMDAYIIQLRDLNLLEVSDYE